MHRTFGGTAAVQTWQTEEDEDIKFNQNYAADGISYNMLFDKQSRSDDDQRHAANQCRINPIPGRAGQDHPHDHIA